MEIKNTIKISAPISPYTTEDLHPTHFALFGKGGFRTVDTLEERDSIPMERREEGMHVYVRDEEKLFALKDGIENLQWVLAEKIIFGDSFGKIEFSKTEPKDIDSNTIWMDLTSGSMKYRNEQNTEWIQVIMDIAIDGGDF